MSLWISTASVARAKSMSFGTGVADDLDACRAIPLTSMPHGQAMAMFALTENLHQDI